jgi:hypothetical protein
MASAIFDGTGHFVAAAINPCNDAPAGMLA